MMSPLCFAVLVYQLKLLALMPNKIGTSHGLRLFSWNGASSISQQHFLNCSSKKPLSGLPIGHKNIMNVCLKFRMEGSHQIEFHNQYQSTAGPYFGTAFIWKHFGTWECLDTLHLLVISLCSTQRACGKALWCWLMVKLMLEWADSPRLAGKMFCLVSFRLGLAKF